MMPLTMINAGEKATVERLGGRDEEKRYLMSLGFVPDSQIEVVSRIGGNVIVLVKDSRIAVNSDMARHIMVNFN